MPAFQRKRGKGSCEPCDPSYPVGPGDVPPSGEDSGTYATDTSGANGFNPTTTTTTSAPMYQSLNNQQDTINDFNKI